MQLFRIACMLVLAAALPARAQFPDDWEPRTGPGLGGHRNDGVAVMLGVTSLSLGVATLFQPPAGEDARLIAGVGVAVGLGSAIAGELMRQNDSARPSLARMASGLGIATATIGTVKLFKPPSRRAKSIELAPTVTEPSNPHVGIAARIKF